MIICPSCSHRYSSDEPRCSECGFAPLELDGLKVWAPEYRGGQGGFPEESFEGLAHAEAANFWFRARNDLISWMLCKYAPEASSFLEIGCGTGFVLSGLAASKPTLKLSGSELFATGLQFARSRVPDADLMQMDARSIPFDQEFDAIGAFDVLEHIPEDEWVLEQMHRALKKRGFLMLTVPQHQWLWSATDERACHVRRYSREELHRKVENAGFKIQRSTSFVSLLLPAMLLSRVRKPSAAAQRSDDPKEMATDMNHHAELNLPSGLNTLLYSFMRVEGVLIKWGVDFCAGGSRILVARKAD